MKLSFDLDSAPDGQVRMAIVIDDEVIWPHPRKDNGYTEFDPEDIISYLADAWQALLLAQSWPIAFDANQEPRSITGLQRAAEERWDQLSGADEEQVQSEHSSLSEFLYHHDLSQMKFGAGLQSCYALRQQGRLRIEACNKIFDRVLFADFVKELTKLGNYAVDVLKNRDNGKDAAKRIIARWEERERFEPIAVAALIAGVPRIVVETSPELQNELVSELSTRNFMDIANDNANPVYAAARSSGALGPGSLTEVLRRIRAIPSGDASRLRCLRGQIRDNLRDINQPRDQGIRAASFIRELLGQQDNVSVDLDALSNRIGARIERVDIPDGRLDGIASNSPEHGPAILLNSKTRRQGAGPDDLERSLRFTWAHEIGHLLLDEEDWPALVDAVRQRVPRVIETRANAFAAYLLLPVRVAYCWWEEDASPLDWDKLQQFLNKLTSTFGLPRIVASRQLARGAPPERRMKLESIFRANIERYGGG